MNRYVWGARALVVGAGAYLIINGVLPKDGAFGPSSLRRASTELLYGEKSPFQSLTDVAQSSESSTKLNDFQTVGLPEGAVSPERTFEYTIKRGQTLLSLWREIGGSVSDVDALTKALAKAGISTKEWRQGDDVSVTHRAGELVEVRKKISPEKTMVIAASEADGYSARIEKISLKTRERRVTGTIMSSLVDSASGLSLPYSVVDDVVDLFSNRVEFSKDLQPGDTFTIVFEERYSETDDYRDIGVIKAASLNLSGKMLAVVRDVSKDGAVRYFDEKGEMPTKAFLRYPVKYTRISSVFSHARFHPVLKINRPHLGVDFAAPIGTPVRTVGDGVVVFAGYSASGGNMVRILHDSRYTTEYMHLNSIAKSVKKGSKVTRGDSIGTLGNTGLSSGPHLHYALFDKGRYIDPMKAKITAAPDSIKPPATVLAMIAELKKSHQAVAVARKGGGKNA